jgi:hypothetical protein
MYMLPFLGEERESTSGGLEKATIFDVIRG